MTGIERLRKTAEVYRNNGNMFSAAQLTNIADQIERERACDSDTAENVRLIVGGVVDEMERHVSGVECAEDSPVARWARELREALGGEGRDHADEREAIAWVEEHGGLERVKKLLDWVVVHCSTKQQLDFDFWLSGRVMHELGFDEDMADRGEVEHRLLARLMPEGCDWEFIKLHMSNLRGFMLDVMDRLGVDKSDSDAPEIAFDVLDRRLMPDGMEWPMYESGEPVRIGDVVSDVEVRSVVFRDGGILLSDCTSVPGWGTWRSYKEPIRRPAPKVLDADGVEIRVGDTVCGTRDMEPMRVVDTDSRECGFKHVKCEKEGDGFWFYCPGELTHKLPVLAADGKPLREGETVWRDDGEMLEVLYLRPDGLVDCCGEIERPERLTHERPVADTWERLEEDAGCTATKYNERCGTIFTTKQQVARDLVRRAKALAERERGE